MAERHSGKAIAEYRQWLVAAEQKSQESFDKTVLSLSGGALGISFIFLKDVIHTAPVVLPAFLLAAWVCWGLSSLAILISFFMSQQALKRAIRQVDSNTIHAERPGGNFSTATAICNLSGAILFFAGVVFITIFAGANLNNRGQTNVEAATASEATAEVNATETAD